MADEHYLGLPGFKEFILQIYSYYMTRVESEKRLNTKVDKIEGKGLSEEDFTSALKGKLEGIETGAEVNRIATLTIDNVEQPIANKTVNIHIPLKVSELTNDKQYQTLDEVGTSIKKAFDDFTSIEFQVVTELPSTGKNGVFYLIKHQHDDASDSDKELYDEYIWNTSQSSFEKIGNTDVNLKPLWDAIDAEATRAKDVEDNLQTELNNEVSARSDADTLLQNGLDAEVTNRKDAITQEVEDRNNAIQTAIEEIGTFTVYLADYDDELLVFENKYKVNIENKTEVTDSDRAYWNNKVTSYVSDSEGDDGTIEATGENLVLTKKDIWGTNNNG